MANEKSYNLVDATFSTSFTLPPQAATPTTHTAFDLGANSNGAFLAPCELDIAAPALTATQLFSTSSLAYKVQESTDNSTFTTLADSVIAQSGAATAAAVAAQTVRFDLPSDVSRYVRVMATQTGSGGVPSASSCTVKLVF